MNRLKFKTPGKIIDPLREIYKIFIHLIKKNPKYVTIQLVGLGNTRISTNYPPKPPRKLDVRATSHLRLRACDQCTSTTLIGGKDGAGPIHVTRSLRDQRSTWMQDRCKVYMDSYMASNGSCFMVTWIIFKNHLLEVDLTQKRETMTLWMLTTIDSFYSIMCEDPHE